MTVLLVAVLPLGAIGLWVTRSAARSGRSLLRSQLEAQLSQVMREVDHQWLQQRSDLMTLGENEPVRVALLDTASAVTSLPDFVERAFAQMSEFNRVEIRDRTGRVRFVMDATGGGFTGNGGEPQRAGDARGIAVQLPITDLGSGDTIGTIAASLRVAALLPAATRLPSSSGPLTAVFTSGLTAAPPGVDVRLFTDDDIEWGSHHWLTARRQVAEPPMELAIAGALEPYVGRFEANASRSAIALLATASIVVMAVVLLTRRMTREVERELAHREALAAAGEFASELAHEVRNPLTAIRLDLQRVEEDAADPASVRSLMPRVLRQVDRLDRAVTGALQVARGGSIVRVSVDLREVLDAARRTTEPELGQRKARVSMASSSDAVLRVRGDALALEHLFANLLLNAAQSLTSGGEVRVGATRIGEAVEVTIADTGSGMTSWELQQLGKPFHSSRRDGTGLGLKIARRIVASHEGELEMRSIPGVGTTVLVRLPAT